MENREEMSKKWGYECVQINKVSSANLCFNTIGSSGWRSYPKVWT